MKGKLYLDEVVENKERKFGADSEYYPVRVQDGDCEVNALFTIEQIKVAIERAQNNPEDVPDKTLWEILIG